MREALAAAALLLGACAPASMAETGPPVAIDPAMVRGPATAPVTIVAFSDYQCPYCRNAEQMLAELLNEFPDKVRLVVKDFPLGFHAGAEPAAIAARCAKESGRYWEYHDLLFVAQPAFTRADLMLYAKRLGLPQEAFAACLDSGRYRDAVKADAREGRAAGVTATPTFFVNGRKIVGAQPIEVFRQAVLEALGNTTAKER